MAHEVSYKGLPRWQADDKAIDDLRHYVGEKTFKVLREEADQCTTVKHLREINAAMAFAAGVQGYPFHAFARRYMLTAYREWMHTGDDAQQTDEHGFPIKAGTNDDIP